MLKNVQDFDLEYFWKFSAISWSMKGKQLAVGQNDGKITQYKPELKAVKMVPPPDIFPNTPHKVTALLWVANFQFIAAFKDLTDNSKKPGKELYLP